MSVNQTTCGPPQSGAGRSAGTRSSLDAIVHGGVVLRHEVEAQGRALVKTVRQHMELEEEDVFPLADAKLADSDWVAVEEQAPKYNDPVFGDPDPARFRTLFAHLTEELDLPVD